MAMTILVGLIVLVAALLSWLIFINMKSKVRRETELEEFYEGGKSRLR